MKIYVDKHELVVIEHDNRFVVIDPQIDFEPGHEFSQQHVSESAYVPYTDVEADGDVLVFESNA